MHVKELFDLLLKPPRPGGPPPSLATPAVAPNGGKTGGQ